MPRMKPFCWKSSRILMNILPFHQMINIVQLYQLRRKYYIVSADSTPKCDKWIILEEYLICCFHSQAFSWTVIEFYHHRLDLLIRNIVELSFFREVLSGESIGVFIELPFPSGIRMCKEKLGIQIFSKGFMLGKQRRITCSSLRSSSCFRSRSETINWTGFAGKPVLLYSFLKSSSITLQLILSFNW